MPAPLRLNSEVKVTFMNCRSDQKKKRKKEREKKLHTHTNTHTHTHTHPKREIQNGKFK